MIIDLHNHSRECSQCSKIDAVTLADRYAARDDIDGVCLTDHLSERNLYYVREGRELDWTETVDALQRGYELARERGALQGLQVFFGFEYGIGFNDILVYGLEPAELVERSYLLDFNVEALRRLRSELPHAALIQAHPFRKRCEPLVDTGVLHGIEVYNGMFFHDRENQAALEFARQKSLIATGGTDCHEDDVGRMMTRFSVQIRNNRELGEAIQGEHIAGFRIKDVVRDENIPYSVTRAAAGAI
jgi:hypothetical protein